MPPLASMQRPSLFYLIPVNNRSFILTPLVLGHKGSKEPNANDFWTNFIAFTAEMAVIRSIYCCHLLASFLIFLDLFTKSNSAKGFGSNKLGISQTEIRLWTEKKHRDVSFLFPSYSFPILFIQGLGSDDTRTAVTSGLGCWHICQARSHPRHSCCLPLQSLQNGRISLLLLPCAHTNHFHHRPPSYLVATSCSNEFMLQNLQTCETADVQFMSICQSISIHTICPWQERLWPSPLCHSSGLGTAQGLKVNLPTVTSSYPRAAVPDPTDPTLLKWQF